MWYLSCDVISFQGRIYAVILDRNNRKGGTASLRLRTCVKRNAVFGARFKGLSLYFLYQKGNLMRIKRAWIHIWYVSKPVPPCPGPPPMIILVGSPVRLSVQDHGCSSPWSFKQWSASCVSCLASTSSAVSLRALLSRFSWLSSGKLLGWHVCRFSASRRRCDFENAETLQFFFVHFTSTRKVVQKKKKRPETSPLLQSLSRSILLTNTVFRCRESAGIAMLRSSETRPLGDLVRAMKHVVVVLTCIQLHH